MRLAFRCLRGGVQHLSADGADIEEESIAGSTVVHGARRQDTGQVSCTLPAAPWAQKSGSQQSQHWAQVARRRSAHAQSPVLSSIRTSRAGQEVCLESDLSEFFEDFFFFFSCGRLVVVAAGAASGEVSATRGHEGRGRADGVWRGSRGEGSSDQLHVWAVTGCFFFFFGKLLVSGLACPWLLPSPLLNITVESMQFGHLSSALFPGPVQSESAYP